MHLHFAPDAVVVSSRNNKVPDCGCGRSFRFGNELSISSLDAGARFLSCDRCRLAFVEIPRLATSVVVSWMEAAGLCAEAVSRIFGREFAVFFCGAMEAQISTWMDYRRSLSVVDGGNQFVGSAGKQPTRTRKRPIKVACATRSQNKRKMWVESPAEASVATCQISCGEFVDANHLIERLKMGLQLVVEGVVDAGGGEILWKVRPAESPGVWWWLSGVERSRLDGLRAEVACDFAASIPDCCL